MQQVGGGCDTVRVTFLPPIPDMIVDSRGELKGDDVVQRGSLTRRGELHHFTLVGLIDYFAQSKSFLSLS